MNQGCGSAGEDGGNEGRDRNNQMENGFGNLGEREFRRACGFLALATR